MSSGDEENEAQENVASSLYRDSNSDLCCFTWTVNMLRGILAGEYDEGNMGRGNIYCIVELF